ncbi:MAG: NAD(P)/FAD-dependent oxidoreductase [Acidimicrobiia bacterium]
MTPDVVIVGGGVMGSSTAYHLLSADPSLRVLVIEKDDRYARASTVLSDGNVRIQFNLEENIRISRHAMEVLASFDDDMATPSYRPEVAARHQGNLFLADVASRSTALGGIELQTSLGCEVAWLDSGEIAARFTAFATDGIVGGTFAQADGSVDPSAVLRGYRSQAIARGAEYVEDEVTDLTADAGHIVGARLRRNGDVRCPIVVITAGAWTADLVRPLGIELPVLPVMRTVYVVSTTVSTEGLPSVFLPSGIYAIPESDETWLMAWSRPEDPVGFDFTPAGRQRFTDLIWPELYAHLPAFDRLQIETTWAGLYAVNTLDGNAIIGEWPTIEGLFVATGFSGHGFQQGPAVGRHLAEQILGMDHMLDLARLGPSRVIENRPLHEHAGRLI